MELCCRGFKLVKQSMKVKIKTIAVHKAINDPLISYNSIFVKVALEQSVAIV
jgi:alanine racemase